MEGEGTEGGSSDSDREAGGGYEHGLTRESTREEREAKYSVQREWRAKIPQDAMLRGQQRRERAGSKMGQDDDDLLHVLVWTISPHSVGARPSSCLAREGSNCQVKPSLAGA